jgi:drug/metabolite transporter (DMT)-like permease
LTGQLLSISPTSRFARGYLICILSTFLWSSTGVLIRYLTETYRLPPLVLALWRDIFVATGLFLLFAVIKPALLQAGRRHVRFLVVYGFVVALFNSMWTVSVSLNGAAVATVLAYSSAAFTAVLGWWFLKEKLSLGKIVAVSISMAGCIFVSGAYNPAAWQLNPLGIATGLLSGLLFAAYSLMGRVSANRGINPWTALAYSFGIAAVFIFGFNLAGDWLAQKPLLSNLFWLGSSLPGWGVLLFLALGPTVGGFGLYTVSLGYLPASVANLIATLEPILTAILAYLFLGEMLTVPQLIGGGLIFFSVILLRLVEDKA